MSFQCCINTFYIRKYQGNLWYFLVTNKINFTYHMVILIVARLAFVEKKHHDVSIKMA